MIFRKPSWRKYDRGFASVSSGGSVDSDISTTEDNYESTCLSGEYHISGGGNHSECNSNEDDIGIESHCFSDDEFRETDSYNNSSV